MDDNAIIVNRIQRVWILIRRLQALMSKNWINNCKLNIVGKRKHDLSFWEKSHQFSIHTIWNCLNDQLVLKSRAHNLLVGTKPIRCTHKQSNCSKSPTKWVSNQMYLWLEYLTLWSFGQNWLTFCVPDICSED